MAQSFAVRPTERSDSPMGIHNASSHHLHEQAIRLQQLSVRLTRSLSTDNAHSFTAQALEAYHLVDAWPGGFTSYLDSYQEQSAGVGVVKVAVALLMDRASGRLSEAEGSEQRLDAPAVQSVVASALHACSLLRWGMAGDFLDLLQLFGRLYDTPDESPEARSNVRRAVSEYLAASRNQESEVVLPGALTLTDVKLCARYFAARFLDGEAAEDNAAAIHELSGTLTNESSNISRTCAMWHYRRCMHACDDIRGRTDFSRRIVDLGSDGVNPSAQLDALLLTVNSYLMGSRHMDALSLLADALAVCTHYPSPERDGVFMQALMDFPQPVSEGEARFSAIVETYTEHVSGKEDRPEHLAGLYMLAWLRHADGDTAGALRAADSVITTLQAMEQLAPTQFATGDPYGSYAEKLTYCNDVALAMSEELADVSGLVAIGLRAASWHLSRGETLQAATSALTVSGACVRLLSGHTSDPQKTARAARKAARAAISYADASPKTNARYDTLAQAHHVLAKVAELEDEREAVVQHYTDMCSSLRVVRRDLRARILTAKASDTPDTEAIDELTSQLTHFTQWQQQASCALGGACIDVGLPHDALRALLESERACEALGDVPAQLTVLTELSRAHMHSGQWGAATGVLERAVRLAHKHGLHDHASSFAEPLKYAYEQLGRHTSAHDVADKYQLNPK